MKIEPLNNNSYRIRKYYKGKSYTIVLPYKPTQKEAIILLAEKMDRDEAAVKSRTFKKAYEDYCESKRNILSPSTFRGYKSIINNMPEDFLKTRIPDITNEQVQKVVNDYAKDHSPKSTRNFYALISVVCEVARPNFALKCALPQAEKKEPYIPTENDAKALFEAVKGSDYEVAVKLAALGLRRSEICALTTDDLKGNTLTISKAMVQDDNQKWKIKGTKTTDSTREIYLPDELVELIKNNGMYKGHPDSITQYVRNLQKRLKMPRFSIHKLRHFYASYAHSMGIPDAYIMEAGGWKTPNVLNAVYKHALKDKNEEMQSKVANKLKSLF